MQSVIHTEMLTVCAERDDALFVDDTTSWVEESLTFYVFWWWV